MRPRSRRYKRVQANSCEDLLSLQKKLLLVWEKQDVDEYYQNLLLNYMDSLPEEQAQALITREIRAAHEGNSQFFKLADAIKERKKELVALGSLIGTRLQEGPSSEEMAEVASILGELRDNNLQVAEMLMGLHTEYSKDHQPVSDQCMQMLLSLDADNSFLKESFLNRFILFQQGYDPFFLYHYQMKGRKTPALPHPTIDKLFNLNISYACRLLKARNRLLQFLATGRLNDTKMEKRSKSLGPLEVGNETSFGFYKKTERQSADEKRQTSNKFKIRSLTLQKAKEREKLHSIETTQRQSKFQKGVKTPLIKPDRFRTLISQGQDDDEDEVDEKFVPVRYNMKKSMPHSQLIKDLRRDLTEDEDKSPKDSKRTLNLKEKLKPIEQKPKNGHGQTEEIKGLPRLPQGRRQQQPSSSESEEYLPAKLNQSKSYPSASSIFQKRDVKMRAGKAVLSELKDYLNSLESSEEVKASINPKYMQSLAKTQSYLSQFTINGQLAAVGLSLALPDGDYMIKLWAPLKNCDEASSKFLLTKYLDYLQKQTASNNFYYSGSLSKLFLSLNFNSKTEKVLVRARVGPKLKRQLEYPQFFSLKCSNILFPQENKSINLLSSDQIENFNENNYYAQPSFSEIKRESLNKDILLLAKVSEDIKDTKALNSILEDEELDTYEVSSVKIEHISAIRLSLLLRCRCLFVAGEGYFKFQGEEIYRKDASLVCRVNFAQHRMFFLAGKGFAKMHSFLESAKKQSKKPCEFSLKMFSKQLYGRLLSNGDQCSYGNWEFSLCWKDELQGRVRHNMTNCDTFGSERFFFAIGIDSSIFFSFQVKSEDFLF